MARFCKATLLLIAAVSADYAIADEYTTTCRVDGGFAVARIETDDARLSIEGRIKVKTYDRRGRSVGSINSRVDETILADSVEVLAMEPVDWYVKSCTLDVGDADVVIERTRVVRTTEVVVQRPDVVVEPQIVFGLPLPPLFPAINTVVHTHSEHCGHSYQHTEVYSGRGSRGGSVIVRREEPSWPQSRRSVHIESHGSGYRPQRSRQSYDSRVISVRHD